MTDSSSSSAPMPGLGDLLMLLGGNNPFAGIGKALAQFQRGVGDFLDAVENFNQSMEQMNEIAGRVNRLLDDVEPPIRALMPQVTRTLKNADAMMIQMNAVPKDVGEMMSLLGDVARRLQPLGQLAETAGGMFGLKPFANLLPGGNRGATTAQLTPEPTYAPPAPRRPPATKAPAKKAAATTRSGAKKAPVKKAPAKTTGGTRAASRKSTSRSS